MNRRTLVGGFVATATTVTLMRSSMVAHEHGSATPEAHHGEDHGAGTGTGAAFMEITNTGDEPDTLVAASSDVAEVIEIHTMEMDGDIMRMKEVEDGLEIPAGETVILESGGLHVMLINLTRDLRMDDEYVLTLQFEHAGEVDVTVVVASRAPDDTSVVIDNLEITGAFSRPAPMLGAHSGTPVATPDSH